MAAGDDLAIPAVAAVAKSAPNGKLVATLAAEDKSGKSLFTIEYDMSLGASSTDTPPIVVQHVGTSSRGVLRGSKKLMMY